MVFNNSFFKIVLINFLLFLTSHNLTSQEKRFFMSVSGLKSVSEMGITLTHEHILVDFIGAKETNSSRWDIDSVIRKSIPFLKEVKQTGANTFFEASIAFQGRDPLVTKLAAEKSGLNIVLNTGYYGADGNKYLPTHAYTETAKQLANRWVDEYKNGIGDTNIKPGFIKISVPPNTLEEIHKKLTYAAALTHIETGLTITSHTGPAIPAFEQMEIIQKAGVNLNAFVWVHAQFEKDKTKYIEAAKQGVWISLDGVNEKNYKDYVTLISYMKAKGYLHKILISQDSGWYTVGQKNGGNYKGYTAIFNYLVPFLKESGFTQKEINILLIKNPAEAFYIRKQLKQ